MWAKEAALDVTLSNQRETPVTLEAVYSDLGEISGDFPITLAAGQMINTTFAISTDGLPGIFTLVLDFGEDGQGTILAIPQS